MLKNYHKDFCTALAALCAERNSQCVHTFDGDTISDETSTSMSILMSSTERTFIVSTHENEVVWYENCMILYLYIDISYISIDIVFISDWHICFCLRYEYHDYNEMMTWCFHCRLTSTGWLDRIVQSATGPTTRLDGPMTLLRSAARDKGPRRVGEVEEYSHHFKDMFQLAMVYHHTTIIRTRQVVQVYLKSCVKTLRLGSQTWTIFQWSHWTPPPPLLQDGG